VRLSAGCLLYNMKTVLFLPREGFYGNLIWMPPYVYPNDSLEEGIASLESIGYFVTQFPEGDGLAFKAALSSDEIIRDFKKLFPWMEFTLDFDGNTADYKEHIFKYQLIVLPVGRLMINEAFLHPEICLFPPGEFGVESMKLKDLKGLEFNSKPENLRDSITQVTNVDLSVFQNQALIVFKKELKIEKYMSYSHHDDVDLIRECSAFADRLLDIIRFYESDITQPEFLPCKPGMWDNSRYSSMLIYFPGPEMGFIQAREVELKMFSKSIGMDLTMPLHQINNHIMLNSTLGEVGYVTRHALRMNSLLLESEDETMKFAQIMILLDFLGNPHEYMNFKKIKTKLISALATSKTNYHELSNEFRYYSEELRTEVIHNGKRLENLIPIKEERFSTLKVLQMHIRKIMSHQMDHARMTWVDYDGLRDNLGRILLES
jgi:hypothetical protein